MVDSTQPNTSHNLGFILNTLFFYWKRDANKMLSEVQTGILGRPPWTMSICGIVKD
ncbi:hypothetical protein ACB092_11G096900 [Castanea dentata]